VICWATALPLAGVLEAVVEHLHNVSPGLVLLREEAGCQWKPLIMHWSDARDRGPVRRQSAPSAGGVVRDPAAQRRITRNTERVLSQVLRQATLDLGLKPPRHSADQVLPMMRRRLLAEQLPMAPAQFRHGHILEPGQFPFEIHRFLLRLLHGVNLLSMRARWTLGIKSVLHFLRLLFFYLPNLLVAFVSIGEDLGEFDNQVFRQRSAPGGRPAGRREMRAGRDWNGVCPR